MSLASDYKNCFSRIYGPFFTKDYHFVDVYSFDPSVLSPEVYKEWANHFRNQYESDDFIDMDRDGIGLSREEYLLQEIFPDKNDNLGRATRTGDFGEIMVADFLEYVENYWVPRIRYDDKKNRNCSPQGSDVVAIKYVDPVNFQENPSDILKVIEVKAQFASKSKPKNRLQDAIDSSKKDNIGELDNNAEEESNNDVLRTAHTLNYMVRRLNRENRKIEAARIKRFQNRLDHPHENIVGVAACFDNIVFDCKKIRKIECSSHPNAETLKMLIFSGENMMNLVHALYESAAHEA